MSQKRNSNPADPEVGHVITDADDAVAHFGPVGAALFEISQAPPEQRRTLLHRHFGPQIGKRPTRTCTPRPATRTRSTPRRRGAGRPRARRAQARSPGGGDDDSSGSDDPADAGPPLELTPAAQAALTQACARIIARRTRQRVRVVERDGVAS